MRCRKIETHNDSKSVSPSADVCPQCGKPYGCVMAKGASAERSCWCMSMARLETVQAAALSCYCSSCLENKLAEQSNLGRMDKSLSRLAGGGEDTNENSA